MGFNSGRHYWELKLEHYATERDIFAGICPKQRCEALTELNDVYGWICSMDKKLKRVDGAMTDETYGDYSSIGDTIGVLLEFVKDGTANLTFYKNGRSVGICYSGIPNATYYPCIALSAMSGNEVIVSLNSKAKQPVRSLR